MKPDMKKTIGIFVGTCIIAFIVIFGAASLTSKGNSLEKQLQLGQNYLAEAKYEQAIVEFSKVLELEPKALKAYEGLVNAYIKTEDYEKAQDVLQKGIAVYESLEEREQTDVSKKIYEELLKLQEEIEGILSKNYEDAYKELIAEYQEAANVEESEWFSNHEYYKNTYSKFNLELLDYYHEGTHYDSDLNADIECELLYGQYDIDKNGIPELLIAEGGHELYIHDIYTFDGKNVINIFPESNENMTYSIYTNGIITQYKKDYESDYFELTGTKYIPIDKNSIDFDELLHFQWSWQRDDWVIFAEDVPGKTIEQSAVLTEDEVYNKLVQHYKKGTEDDSGDDLTVMEGDVYKGEFNKDYYETNVRCGVPGNPQASQVLYEVSVDMITGEVTQIRVLTDNKLTRFNLLDEQ